MLLDVWEGVARPVIGMLHVPPLAGAPRYCGRLDDVRRAVLDDARALLAGGVDGLLLENFGDAPFYPRRVPRSVVAQMTALASAVRHLDDAPLGINVLRNDGASALAIAHAAGASFIRVNVLCGARLTDQGIIQGIAHELLRLRERLRAGTIKIMADVRVKHSAPLAAVAIEDEVRDTIVRGGADAIVVSGSATGAAVELEELEQVKRAAAQTPVLIGSGVTLDNAARLLPLADGCILGTALKHGGLAANPVDRKRVAALVKRIRG